MSGSASGGSAGAATEAIHVARADAHLLERLQSSQCSGLTRPELRRIGIYQRGEELWLVLAPQGSQPPAASAIPAGSRQRQIKSTARLPQIALQLVNEVRARGARCGEQAYAPAPPLALSGTLAMVAQGHAIDMATHEYFEHEDLQGHSPAQRVRAAGYAENLVGENIAYGPRTVEEVVQGWLDSPGHCENIMDPRFAQLGIAYAPGAMARPGTYWVQLLAAPRA